MHAAVHPYIVADSQLAALSESRRLVEYSFEHAEADVTSTHKHTRYRFVYMVSKTAL